MAGIGGVHLAVADRVFRAVGPAGAAGRASPTTRSPGASTPGCAAAPGRSARARARRSPCAAARRPRRCRTRAAAAWSSARSTASRRHAGARGQRAGAADVGARRRAARSRSSPTPWPRRSPTRRGRLVVFVHGLMETELGWQLRAARDRRQLRRAARPRPVDHAGLVRYNTGRHISENGALAGRAARGARRGVAGRRSREIALVGHSMGGLVARSACHRAGADGAAWVGRVRHVVSLGTPHMGAPLAQGVHYADARRSARCPRRGRSATSCAGAARASATCARARWSTRTGATATPTRCAPRPATEVPLLDGRDALLRLGDDHARPAPPARAPDRRLRSCSQPSASGRSAHAPARLPRRGRPATSAAPTTSRCSTTPPCTSSCASGCRCRRSPRCPALPPG